jgi:hypothetical protein
MATEFKSAKLTVNYEMSALDRKDRGFYDSLTVEEKKRFSNFLMIRYGSSVGGSSDMQAYYLMSTNTKLNKNFFSIPKEHEKLQWLTVTTISPGMGNQNHQWISMKKKEGSDSKLMKFLRKQYPTYKEDDLKTLIAVNEPSVWKTMAKDLGMTPEQIKKEF